MFLLNGQILQIDTAFTHNGIQYPANWLRLTTLEEKEAIGITEVPDPVRPDERFYYVDSQGIAVPKDLNRLKEYFTAQTKQNVYNILQQSDWYVIRQIESNIAIPDAVKTYRNSIRNFADKLEAKITNATTIEELQITLNNVTWPQKE